MRGQAGWGVRTGLWLGTGARLDVQTYSLQHILQAWQSLLV